MLQEVDNAEAVAVGAAPAGNIMFTPVLQPVASNTFTA